MVPLQTTITIRPTVVMQLVAMHKIQIIIVILQQAVKVDNLQL